MVRQKIVSAKKIIIKIGSKVLLNKEGKPDYDHINHLVAQVAGLHHLGKEVVLVTSGAVAFGLEAMSISKRPKEMAVVQAAAALGQVRLIHMYEDLFARYGCKIAQVLLTHDDLKDRKRHLNVKNTFNTLLSRNIIPIVNENDVVSTEEITFSDNDVLASLVAMLLEASVLILLTTSDGFLSVNSSGQKERVSHILALDDEVLSHVEKHMPGLSKGGMESKLLCASNMIHVGGLAVIASGKELNCISNIFNGLDFGTVVGQPSVEKANQMPGKKRWLAFYNQPQGKIIVDDGAKKALLIDKGSLLPIGIKDTIGVFKRGAVVQICDLNGQNFAKGITSFDSEQILKAMGLHSDELLKLNLGTSKYEIVHRDDLVITK